MDEQAIYAIERPHPKLMTLYLIRAILTLPGVVIALPLLYFRYHTLRYKFDDEGISMRWGILFRRQINLTYARIQDIHLTSGVLQRWLGLADIKIQTASGSAQAEMTIEGLLEFEAIRDFLYARMRGIREERREGRAQPAPPGPAGAGFDEEALALLTQVRDEMRATRVALERLGQSGERG